MTSTPPDDPRTGAPDPDEKREVVQRSTEEIAVTEVPDDVARELEELFSDTPATSDDTVIVIDGLVAGDLDQSSPRGELDASISQMATRAEPTLGASASIGIDSNVITLGGESDAVVIIDDVDVDRIVIVDNDQPDPTFEERRRKRLRREKLKKVRWFKWALIAVIALIAGIAILASPIFSVREVEVEGAVYTSSEAIQAATDLLEGDSYFTLETDKASNILKQDSWVEDVRISKHFPSTVVIEIAERKPIVWYVGEDNKARVVDAQGQIIAVLDGWPTDYLQVKGIGPSLEAGAIADIGYRAAAQTVIALPDELARLVESLELGAGGELSMTLRSGTVVRFGSPTDLQNKLVSVVVLLRRQDPSEIAVIDVSTGEITVATR